MRNTRFISLTGGSTRTCWILQGRQVRLRLPVKRIAAILFVASSVLNAADVPENVAGFTQKYCVTCHGPDKQEGDFRIDKLSWSLTDSSIREHWDLIDDYVSEGDMPPKKAPKRPDSSERAAFLKSLRSAFAKADEKARVGGTPLRRLNRVEYLNTVRDLFGIRMIKLPLSFPEDATSEEFDTMPKGLFLSPALMEAYHETATDIADRFVPLPNPPKYSSSHTASTIGGDQTRRWFGPDKESLKFTGFNHSGWVGALWDSLFVAPTSGVYRIRLLANAQAKTGADGKPLRVSFYTFDPTEEQLPKRYRIERAALVAEQDIPPGEPQWIECDVPIEAGETFHVYCANRLPADEIPRGDLNRSQINKALKDIRKRPEPTIEIHAMKVDGPVDVSPRVVKFFGDWPPKLNRQELNEKLLPLAAQIFRRPLTERESDVLATAVLRHGEAAGPEFGWHYAIRRLLCSPAFLYRASEPDQPSQTTDGGPGKETQLTEHALASRLSYFLWSTMPDQELIDLATAKKLSDLDILEAQTRRMIADPKSQQFIKHFTGQWLGNRTVASINVCDNRYEWDDNVRYGFVRSTEMFFEEVLRENLPISTFVDSNFTYANSAMRVVWGMKPDGDRNLGAVAARQRQSLVWPEPKRIDLADSSSGLPEHVLSRGGILGLPGVLTVTGDGVESSPILRGVWVLENLFGQRPPPPPKDVPALDVDTSNATTVRETLAAHQKIETCAKCHRDIDPFGLALENYDAVGGWRDSYGKGKPQIDATAAMPDGRRLDGVASIKQLLKEKPEIFTRCLLTKLLEYGAGRELSIGDRRVVEEIVAAAPDDGYRFQDLIIKAATSEVFRTR